MFITFLIKRGIKLYISVFWWLFQYQPLQKNQSESNLLKKENDWHCSIKWEEAFAEGRNYWNIMHWYWNMWRLSHASDMKLMYFNFDMRNRMIISSPFGMNTASQNCSRKGHRIRLCISTHWASFHLFPICHICVMHLMLFAIY